MSHVARKTPPPTTTVTSKITIMNVVRYIGPIFLSLSAPVALQFRGTLIYYGHDNCRNQQIHPYTDKVKDATEH